MEPGRIRATFPGSETGAGPILDVYVPATPKKRALVIFPGGGYRHLARHEGEEYARHFARHGYTCFVCPYRLGSQGHRHPDMLEDAVAAVHTVRQQADAYGFSPACVGVIGSSAGGHLAASLMVHHQRYETKAACRPDFGILCYPVISLVQEFAHTGSLNALLGESPDPRLIEDLSCEGQVSAQTPPCFLWHTAEDTSVPMQNSLSFANALHRYDIPCECHVYAKGRHGLGLGTSFTWPQEALRFIDQLFSDEPPELNTAGQGSTPPVSR